MFNIKGDLKPITKHLNRTQKKLLPQASAKAINKTLFQIMDAEKAQLHKKLDKPNKFTQKAFKINMAKVNTLHGDIHIQPNRWWYLKWVVDGGTKTGKLGVPIKGNAVLNAFGNIPGTGYKNNRYVKGKKQFRATINGIDGVWLKTGGKRNPGLKLMVIFKRSLTYKKIFPFYKIADSLARNMFQRNMTYELRRMANKH
jgi:hypothetical protein